jgi:hypothetical protein
MIRIRRDVDWPGAMGWAVAVASIIGAAVVRACTG